jgi:EAL domain-containing protein (putative c-di-GMP-specific phosphodiesterase class I)
MQFQPICALNSRRIVGVEALMRWRHPLRGVIGPDEFVPLAERSGQIEELGRLAFEQSAAQLQKWLAAGKLPEEFFVSVNLSPRQLSAETTLADMRTYLNAHKSLAKHIKLEITESQMMVNPEHSAYVLSTLKAMGLGIALDDFGTGHSSLSYLHRFPVDTIKIAAPFVRFSDESGFAHTQAPIIRSIVSLARELDLMVIAEGVETEAERERLMQLDCRFGQGFLFAEAMDGDALQRRLAHNAPAPVDAPARPRAAAPAPVATPASPVAQASAGVSTDAKPAAATVKPSPAPPAPAKTATPAGAPAPKETLRSILASVTTSKRPAKPEESEK